MDTLVLGRGTSLRVEGIFGHDDSGPDDPRPEITRPKTGVSYFTASQSRPRLRVPGPTSRHDVIDRVSKQVNLLSTTRKSLFLST